MTTYLSTLQYTRITFEIRKPNGSNFIYVYKNKAIRAKLNFTDEYRFDHHFKLVEIRKN